MRLGYRDAIDLRNVAKPIRDRIVALEGRAGPQAASDKAAIIDAVMENSVTHMFVPSIFPPFGLSTPRTRTALTPDVAPLQPPQFPRFGEGHWKGKNYPLCVYLSLAFECGLVGLCASREKSPALLLDRNHFPPRPAQFRRVRRIYFWQR